MSDSVFKNIKILVVEDDEINQIVIKKFLELKKITVVCASDGYEAVEQFKNNDDFDLILMDIQLPGMDGIQTSEQIRNIHKNFKKKVPILALTAYAYDGCKEYFLSVGFDDYIVKPINYDFLMKLIKKFILEKV